MKPLTPPDRTRCQGEKSNGYSFMTLGGRPGLERCSNKPTVIVKEKKAGRDGRRGSMALCASCLKAFLRRFGDAYATVSPLTAPRMKRASYRLGVEIIALNDEPAEMDPEVVQGLASVMLLAELFGVTQARVAEDVVAYREKEAKREKACRRCAKEELGLK